MQQKKQHPSQRLQLCLYNWHYLLTFFCFSSEQKQSLPGRRGREGSPSLIPAAWNEAGHADARSSQAEAQILLQQQDTRMRLLHGSATPPDARGRAAGGCTPPQGKKPHFQYEILHLSVVRKLAVLLSRSLRKVTAWHTLKAGIGQSFVMITGKSPSGGQVKAGSCSSSACPASRLRRRFPDTGGSALPAMGGARQPHQQRSL